MMTFPDRVKLDEDLALQFKVSVGRRRALLEAADIMARQFADKVEEANNAITSAYSQSAEKYGLDLARCGYEFDQDTSELVLKAVRYDN